MTPSYEETVESIILVLRHRHKLTSAQAEEVIKLSPFKSIFLQDPEMAAHTSNEAWAKRILDYWETTKEADSHDQRR